MKPIVLAVIFIFISTYNGQAQDKEQPSEKYVIILDIQKHFIQNVIHENEANQLIYTINSIIDTTNPSKIIYVKSVLTTLNISFKGFRIDTLPNLNFDKRLMVVNDNIILKNKANAFECKNLCEYLQHNNAKEIIVLGLMAEHCVYKTLLGGTNLGYRMYTLPNAVVGKSQESKEKILTKLEKKGIKTISFYRR